MDEWPYGNKICVNQPKTIEERLIIANRFMNEMSYKVPIVVDSMNNTFESEFSAWPLRYFIVNKNKVLHVGFPGETSAFDMDNLRRQLQRFNSR